MNKMLVAIFDTEAAADAGLKALRTLHGAGDITLFASSVVARDSPGAMSVRTPVDPGPSGTVTGQAVRSIIGLLGGPMDLAVGSVTGTVARAVRDFWVAGVGLDFIEEAQAHLLPGKVVLVAEIEEEWVIPVDVGLEAVGGQVLRRSRSDLAEVQFDHDIAVVKSEIRDLESEASHASGAAKARLLVKLDAAKARLNAAMQRARQRVVTLKQEADAKADALKRQLDQSQVNVRARIEDRLKRVKGAYHARGAKLAQAWNLTREAVAA